MENESSELLRLSKILLDFEEVKEFSHYIEKMKKFRSDNESEEFSVVKSAFICIIRENELLRKKYNSINLNDVRRPLFKTNDGVDIYGGDKYFSVHLDEGSSHCLVEKHYSTNKNKQVKADGYFSNKKSATKWAIANCMKS